MCTIICVLTNYEKCEIISLVALSRYPLLGKYAVVYYGGKSHYLGQYGSPESKTAYSRFVAEIQANPVFVPSKEEKFLTVRELAAAFLDHVKANSDPINYGHCRIVVLDFLDKFFGDGTLRLSEILRPVASNWFGMR